MPDMGASIRNYMTLFPHLTHLPWIALFGLAALIYASMLLTLWLLCLLSGRGELFKGCALLVLASIPLAIIPPAALLVMGMAVFIAVFGQAGQGRGAK